MNIAAKIVLGILVVFFIAKTCGRKDSISTSSSNSSVSKEWKKSPVDDLIKQLNGEENFSIILFDMDASESGNEYKHQYQIIIEQPDTILEKKTDWKLVSEAFFSQHINDMGMEIASKKNGKLTKQAVPAGYNHYVGNEKYGHWVEKDGSSFWEFYGKYALISSVFNMMTYQRSYWDDYKRGGYYGGSGGYYGPQGSSPVYGTKNYTSSEGNKSSWANKPNTFKEKVRSKVSRSTQQSSRFNSSRQKTSNSFSNKTSRSSSRYKSNRTTRSRSGGFGK
jgi:hypothetical protein